MLCRRLCSLSHTVGVFFNNLLFASLSCPGKQYMRRGFDPNAQGLEWDTAELYMVGQKGGEGREGGRKQGRNEGRNEGRKE